MLGDAQIRRDKRVRAMFMADREEEETQSREERTEGAIRGWGSREGGERKGVMGDFTKMPLPLPIFLSKLFKNW